MNLTLGSVTFQEWEVPNKIEHGSKQRLSANKNIGGQRNVNAMGADPKNIKWAGRLWGPDATSRRDQLQSMCDGGQQVSLMFSTKYYMVVVEDVSFSHELDFMILYEIDCYVVSDMLSGAGAVSSIVQNLTSVTGADVSSINAILPTVQTASVVSTVTTAVNNVSNAGDLDTADITVLSSLIGPLQTAIASTQSAQTSQDDILSTTLAAPTMPQLIALLNSVSSAHDEALLLFQIYNLLTRLTRNIVNAAGVSA